MTRGKLGSNLFSNIAFFGLNIFVSLWLVSYLVRELGVAAYGLVPLATTIASYFNVITAGLNAAVGRHMTVAMSKGCSIEVCAIFNSSLLTSGFVALFMCVCSVPLIDRLAIFIDVPVSLEQDAGWLFFWVVTGLAITTFGTSFQTIIYSHNRFDLQNLANIVGLLVRVSTVLVLFNLTRPELWQVGVSVMSGALAALFVAIWASHRLAPGLRFRINDFSWSVVKNISGTGGWIFVSQVGTLLLINIDLLVANIVVGATAAGQYALVLQWSLLLRNLAMTISGVFGPTMIRLYAEGKHDELVAYAKQSVRAVGLAMAIPVGIVCGLSKSILTVWLGPEFSELAPLMILATLHLSLNLAYLPLHGINMATNKVKVPGLIQIAAGIVNLVMAVILARYMGLYGIAIAGGFVLLLRNILFIPIYSAKILGEPISVFFHDAIPNLVLVVIVFCLSWGASIVFLPSSWFSLCLFSCLVGLLILGIMWVVFLKKSEKVALVLVIKKIANRIRVS